MVDKEQSTPFLIWNCILNNMAAIDKDAFVSITPAKKRKTDPQTDLSDDLLNLEAELCRNLCSLNFSFPVTHVYNPLNYAKETHENYVRKYCKLGQKVLFLGMNPGPFGMAQNGVSLWRETPTCSVLYQCLVFLPSPLKPVHPTPEAVTADTELAKQ